jgi:hypothetical protein
MGAAKLEKHLAEQNYWWANMRTDCAQTCKDSEDCNLAVIESHEPSSSQSR